MTTESKSGKGVGGFGNIMGSGVKEGFNAIDANYTTGNIESGKMAMPVATNPDRTINCDYCEKK